MLLHQKGAVLQLEISGYPKPFISLISVMMTILVSMMITGCVVTGGALTTAAYEGQTPVIKDLLDKGADVNERGGCGLWDVGGDFNATPLLCAAHGGHMESVQLLVDRGANVNARGTTLGRTPLTAAAYARHAGIAKYLMEKGADVDYAMANLQKHKTTADGAVFLKEIAEKQRSAMQPVALQNYISSQAAPPAGIAPMDGQRSTMRANQAMPVVVAPTQRAETARGNDAYAEAKTLNTFDAYETFLKAYPASEHRREALEAMAVLTQKRNGTSADYKKFVSSYEDGLEFVPEKYRLALTGPEGMRVHDIVALRKKGVEDNLIGAKIRMGKGKYKDYSFDEMDALKKMGIPAVLIEAMLDSTSRAKREEEELQKKKAMEDILAEIHHAQNRLEELKAAQPSAAVPAPVSATAQQGQGKSLGDTVTNCTAQISALEACKHLPSFAAMICKATAKSQFPCE